RTFDVASYLRGLGSDSGEIQTISATDFDEYRRINELILAGERITDDIIVATGDNYKCYNNVVISKAADTMLAMAGIEATFVVARTSNSTVNISSRSHNAINVQRIMEKLGGGGHFNLAACQLRDCSVSQAQNKLIETIMGELAPKGD
ncbi:MAG: DHHA1 domain-containing protein, partial [Streptococcus vestibularis]|nr:DHHA1 domain-containing protein [Streptococcus vestibularis]